MLPHRFLAIGIFFGLQCVSRCLGASFSVSEELTEPRLLGNIGIVAGHTYRLSPPNEIFWLNGVTGALWANKTIDREALDSDVIKLFAAADSPASAPIEIEVRVLDVNDNDPTFTPPFKSLEIPESAEVGTQMILSTATDADGPANGISANYAILDSTGQFSLLVDSSLGDQTLVYLRTEKAFNREAKGYYMLNISATDDGSPPRRGYLSVNVTILDRNDNTPTFDISAYSASVLENATVGSEVTVVHATDPDQGDNGKVRYRITADSESTAYFTVNETTGVVTLRSSLDYEAQEVHHVTMEAFDSGESALFAQALLTVSVINVNDNDPEVTNIRYFPRSASIASVEEGAAIGSTVVLLSVSDKDNKRPGDGKISMSLASGNELGHFALRTIGSGNTGLLQVAGVINRQNASRYDLRIRIQDDEAASARFAYQRIEVVVNSPNDHWPVFTDNAYTSRLSELAPVGTCVKAILATDKDVGLPATLRYSIVQGNSLGWFAIDERTGLIQTTTRMRYSQLASTKGQVILRVSARDETKNPKNANATLTVQLSDENDNWPTFASPLYEVEIDDTSDLADVARARATDIDSGVNGTVFHSVQYVQTPDGKVQPTGLCSVDSENGQVSITEELRSNYDSPLDIIIRACDSAPSALCSSAVVRVKFLASAPSEPFFYPEVIFLSLQPGSYNGLEVTKVSATSQNGPSESLQYSISPAAAGLTIHTTSGSISASGNLFHGNARTFTVNAVDSSGKAISSSATVHLVVRGGQSQLQFTSTNYRFRALEGAKPSVLGQVALKFSQNAVEFSIVDGDSSRLFVVNYTTGQIALRSGANLDRERRDTHNLTVVASAKSISGVVTDFTTTVVTINVMDANDNFPRLGGEAVRNLMASTSNLQLYVAQANLYLTTDVPVVGHVVYDAEAADADLGVNAAVTYTMYDAMDIFDVSEQGQVYVKAPFESGRFTDNVRVVACDNGSPVFCAELSLAIEVYPWIGRDILTPMLTITVPEDAPPNTKLVNLAEALPLKLRSVIVVSQSEGVKTAVNFTVNSGNKEAAFGVFPDGQMFLKTSTLDRERQSEHLVFVTVDVSRYGTTVSRDVQVVVKVSDINDNTPTFPRNRYVLHVKENMPFGSTVGEVRAYDLDDALAASVAYSLPDIENAAFTVPFAVDKFSGEITTKCVLDKESLTSIWSQHVQANGSFVLRLQATDNGGEAHESTRFSYTTVEIVVDDVNEFSPEFERQVYYTRVHENSHQGRVVMQLRAFDKDHGQNFTYKLSADSTDSLPFTVEAQNGIISVSDPSSLDRENQDRYTFKVTAIDETKTGQTTVEIVVTDINDEAPVFAEESLSFTVPESFPANSVVGRVVAMDGDESGSDNSALTYSLAPGNSAAVSQTFRVEASSGRIVLTQGLDRERIDSYKIQVSARDSGSPANVATAEVTVTVRDANDNAPEVIGATQFHLTEGHYPTPTSFAQLAARDLDAGDNAKLSFRLLQQEPENAGAEITVDPSSGELFVSGTVDRESLLPGGMLRVKVRVSDSPAMAADALSTVATIYVVIDDLNDSDPVFTSPDAAFIPRHSLAAIGYDIMTITAVDEDDGPNGSISIALAGQNGGGPFFVDVASGKLELFEALSESGPVVQSVEVVARDQGIPSRFTTMMLHVIVGDPNAQNGPVFDRSSYSAIIEENRPPGSSVTSVSASGAQVGYYITGVTAVTSSGQSLRRRPFAIDSATGAITTLASLDREGGATTYSLQVVAVDLTSTRSNPKISSTNVEITVMDVNDNPPSFGQAVLEVIISESVQPGYEFHTLSANDPDATSVVTYSIAPGPGSEDFRVGATSGVVSVGDNGLDRERSKAYIITVVASDGELETTTELAVRVVDVNDHVPVFDHGDYVFVIAEGSSTPPVGGKLVGIVSATDADVGDNAKTTYSFAEDSDQGRFVIDSGTGTITLNPAYNELFDRESRDLYLLLVRATDGGVRSSDARVFVNAGDRNDNAPIFQPGRTDFDVAEDAVIGLQITTVEATDKDLGFNGTVEYSIVAGNAGGHFRVAADNGSIFLQRTLDFETQPIHQLTIEAHDLAPPTKRLRTFLNITIRVANVDDNPPQLVMPALWYVNELSAPATPLFRVGSIDVDLPTGDASASQVRYEVKSKAEEFQIDSVSGLLSAKTQIPALLVNDRYNLTIAVSDQNSTSERFLEIAVTDVNDNTPAFESSSGYSATISEDAEVGTTLTTVIATDGDRGWNGKVQYFIDEPSSGNFKISRETGAVYLAKKLDREAASRETLRVVARDMGAPPRSSNATVRVAIADVNDRRPHFAPAAVVLRVNESTAAALDLVTFTVRDQDSGDAGMVDFRSPSVTRITPAGTSESQSGVMRLSAAGVLTIVPVVDRETASHYSVVITAVDRGSPALTSSASVLVIVEDENEFAPEFRPSVYRGSIPEDADLGSHVVTVSAIDQDAGIYGIVRYSIAGDGKMLPFIIDPTTGIITTSQTLDRETVSTYTFAVVAVDSSGEGFAFSTSAQVTVQIADVNDNPPVFTLDAYRLYSRQATDHLCGVVFAEDPDFGTNSAVTYRMHPDFAHLPFVVDPTRGTIKTIEALPNTFYNFSVVAEDSGDPRKSAEATVTVEEQEGPYPSFISAPSSVTLRENSNPDTEVLFTATTTRPGASGIQYRLAGGNLDGSFTINASSGEVRQTRPLDRERFASYQLLVEARDSGSPPLSSFAQLTVTVSDINDNAPAFTEPMFVGDVGEEDLRLEIVTISANDPDTGVGGTFTYSIDAASSEHPEKFSLDSNGVLRNVVRLNREEKDTYFLTVRATDNGIERLSSTTVVRVTVTDANDNRPKFSHFFSGEIREDARIGDFVVQLSSSDDDVGVNAQVRYGFRNSAEQTFAIDATSGVVTVNGPLDRETTPEYDLRVFATDLDWNTEASVRVTVSDVNDNEPRFDQAHYDVGVPSGSAEGSRIVQVLATDEDEGTNGQVYYTMSSNDESFVIDHSSGEIKSTRGMRCDSLPGLFDSCPWRRTLLVTASDCGRPRSRSSSVNVTITVVAPNLHQPVFAGFELPIAMLHSTPLGSKVFAAAAADGDAGSTVTYQLIDGKNASFFALDARTGELRLMGDLPSHIPTALAVTLRASDDGAPSRHADLELTFETTGENLATPKFDRPSFTAPFLTEGSPFGTFVFTISAQDADDGVNGKVLYSLASSDEGKPFAVDARTGEVTTDGEIDYEAAISYTLTVIATDRGVESRNSSVELTVPIADINDNDPVFNSSYFVAYVPENAAPDSVVTRLIAQDRDSGANRIVRYSAMPQRDLAIGALTGDVSLAAGTRLDFEQRTSYQLTVSAANAGGDPTSADLAVHVTGVNEFAPTFQAYEYRVVTSVNTEQGRVVFTLNGTDDDAGSDGRIFYCLSGWSERRGFDLNPETGEIAISGGASFAVGDVVNLTAVAKNPGLSDASLMAEVSVIVSIVSDECSSHSCQNGAVCRDHPTGPVCECALGFTGENCDVEINECVSNPCENGGVCSDVVGGFACACAVGFTGPTCAVDVDHCAPQPCLNGGTCRDHLTNYTCECPFGTSGINCEQTTLGFAPLSYLGLAHLSHVENHISLEFATVSDSCLLAYNHGGNSSDVFVALELVQGKARLSYSFDGTRTYRIAAEKTLNDGEWHHVVVSTSRLMVSLSVDGCPSGQASCSASQSHSGLPIAHLSGLGRQNLYIGGIASADEVTSHPNQISSYDFVGCMNNIVVNGIKVTTALSSAILQNRGVADGCSRAGSQASSDACFSTANQSVCGYGASCSDRWTDVLCECPDDKSGRMCQEARVGSTFADANYLAYAFDAAYVQATLLGSSGALFASSPAGRRRRQAGGATVSSVQLRFRTRQTASLLAVVEGEAGMGSAALYVDNGTFVYAYTSPAQTIHRTDAVVNDGSWHTVQVSVTSLNSATDISLSVDGEVRLSAAAVNTAIKEFSNPTQAKALYVGGAPVGSYSPAPALAGCVYSFHLDGRPQPLADDGGSAWLVVAQGGPTTGGNVTHGCTGSDVCASGPCHEDQTCVDIWEAYECKCDSGGEVDDSGKCIADAAGLAWWIYVVIVVVAFVLLLVVAYFVHQWRVKKDTSTPYGICCGGKKAVPPVSNRNGIAGRNNNSFESEVNKKSNGTNGSLSAVRPDLISDDVRIVDEEAVSSAALTNSGTDTPPMSPASSSGHRSSVHDRPLTPLHEEQQRESRPPSKLSNKSSSPLPDYEAVMRTRYGKADANSRAATLPPMYESERDSANEGTLGRRGRVPHGVSPLTGELFAITDLSSSSDDKSRERKRSVPGSSYDSGGSRQVGRLANKSPFAAGGRTSPMKGVNALQMNRLTPQHEFNSSNMNRYQTNRPRRVSGSAASSSTTSSSQSHEPGQPSSPTKLPTIEDMVQQLNGLVGLTSEEIELLNGCRSTHSYSSSASGSITTSYPPSVATELAEPIPPMPEIRRPAYSQAERPSSLPGRKIHRVAQGSRSKTPISLSNGHYKLSPSTTKDLCRDLPADLRPSELLQPPPDTSSDEESDIFIQEKAASRRRSSTLIPDLVEPPIMEVDDQDMEAYNSMNGLNFDFLMPYGKHYEALAGVFQQLAALPSLDDEENAAEYNTDSTQSSTQSQGRVSRSSTNRSASSRRTATTHNSSNYTPQRRSSNPVQTKAARTRGLSTSALPRVTSPVEVSRPRSVNCKRTRLEHYV